MIRIGLPLLGLLLVTGCASSPPIADRVADRAQIVALEQQRCDAITRGDVTLLSSVLADDYVHVHGTGRIDTKAGFVANVQQHPRRTQRGELSIRFYSDVAVVTGEQVNITDGVPAAATVTQVLQRDHGKWLFESFQLTFKPAAANPAR